MKRNEESLLLSMVSNSYLSTAPIKCIALSLSIITRGKPHICKRAVESPLSFFPKQKEKEMICFDYAMRNFAFSLSLLINPRRKTLCKNRLKPSHSVLYRNFSRAEIQPLLGCGRWTVANPLVVVEHAVEKHRKKDLKK
jgi:hypothetical protein